MRQLGKSWGERIFYDGFFEFLQRESGGQSLDAGSDNVLTLYTEQILSHRFSLLAVSITKLRCI